MLTLWFLTALAIALFCSNTEAGKMLRELLFGLPVRQLAKLTSARIVVVAIVVAAIAGLLAIAKIDGLMLTAQSVPEAIAWFAAFDVATYIDVIGLLLLIGVTARWRAALRAASAVAARSWRWLIHSARRLHFSRHRPMERRRRTRKSGPPPSDQDDRGWWASAYSWA